MDKLTKQQEKRIKTKMSDQDKRCVPIAEEIIQIIAKHKPSLANHESAEALQKTYAPIYLEIAHLFLDKNIKFVDVMYIMKVAQVAFDNTNNYINDKMAESFSIAECKVFGVDNIRDLTLQNIEDVIQLKSENKK